MLRWMPLVAVLLVSGCTLANVQVNVASERTALENQVLGTYNALQTESLLAASVRGVDPLGRVEPLPQQSGEAADATEAMQVIAFHADDVDAFKRMGWVGENNEGLLTAFGQPMDQVPGDLLEFARGYPAAEYEAVVDQVNQAREVVMRRVVETNENFTMADLPRVRAVFGRINTENALPGERIQEEDGTWTVKS